MEFYLVSENTIDMKMEQIIVMLIQTHHLRLGTENQIWTKLKDGQTDGLPLCH